MSAAELVPCPHCDRTCAGGAGLSTHVRSMHPEHLQTVPLAPVPALPSARRQRHGTPKVGIEWGAPPPIRKPSSIVERLQPAIIELRRRPREWAKVAEFNSKSGAGSCFMKIRNEYPDCEFTTRKSEDASVIYGRFIGE